MHNFYLTLKELKKKRIRQVSENLQGACQGSQRQILLLDGVDYVREKERALAKSEGGQAQKSFGDFAQRLKCYIIHQVRLWSEKLQN